MRVPSARMRCRRGFNFSSSSNAFSKSSSVRKIPTRLLHEFLQVAVNFVGELAAGAFEWREHFALGILQLRGIERAGLHGVGVVGRGFAGALSENEQVGERVSAEAVRAVQSCRGFPGRKKPADGGLSGFGVHADPAHHVVAGWADFHRTGGDVHVGEFLELVIHAGQFFLHVVGGLVGNIQIRAAVFGAAAFLDFGVDRPSDHIARGKFHALGIVLFHETLAAVVLERATFAAHRFGDQNSLHARRPNHSRGMKLHEFHVQQFGARVVGKRHAVGGVFPGIRSDFPGFADAAGGYDH